MLLAVALGLVRCMLHVPFQLQRSGNPLHYDERVHIVWRTESL